MTPDTQAPLIDIGGENLGTIGVRVVVLPRKADAQDMIADTDEPSDLSPDEILLEVGPSPIASYLERPKTEPRIFLPEPHASVAVDLQNAHSLPLACLQTGDILGRKIVNEGMWHFGDYDKITVHENVAVRVDRRERVARR